MKDLYGCSSSLRRDKQGRKKDTPPPYKHILNYWTNLVRKQLRHLTVLLRASSNQNHYFASSSQLKTSRLLNNLEDKSFNQNLDQ